jgi:hypothetical protein
MAVSEAEGDGGASRGMAAGERRALDSQKSVLGEESAFSILFLSVAFEFLVELNLL